MCDQITGDETWIHYYSTLRPNNKACGGSQFFKSSKFKVHEFAGKIMCTDFLGSWRKLLLIDCIPHNFTGIEQLCASQNVHRQKSLPNMLKNKCVLIRIPAFWICQAQNLLNAPQIGNKNIEKIIKQVYHKHVVKICSHEKCKCARKMKIKKITHVVLEMYDCRVRFSIYVQFCHSAIFRKVFL